MVQSIISQANLQGDVARLRNNQQGIVIAVLDARATDADVTKQYINQTFAARVIEHAPGSLAKIQTETAQFWVRLNTPVALGAQVQLRLQGSFAVAVDDNPIASLTPLNPLDLPDHDAPTQLSATGNLIAKVMNAANQVNQANQFNNQAPTLLVSLNQSITQEPFEATNKVAEQLSGAVEKSGVFYESHLNQWVKGNRSLESILSEPQNQFANQSLTTTKINENDKLPSTLSLQSSVSANESVTSNKIISADTIGQKIVGLVRDQLNMVDTRQLAIQFEAWPKQVANLQIEEEKTENNANLTDPIWRVNMKLDLPSLGNVNANLALQGAQLNVIIKSNSDVTREQLQHAKIDLYERLKVSGLSVQHIEIDHE